MTDAGKSAAVRKKIVLIDGSACVFRAYYALPPLTTKAGLPVGAAYGFTLMLLKTLRAYPESMIAVAMDKDSREFRQAIDAQYKANRPPAPEDLKAQFSIVREIVEAFDIPVAEFAGYEADDVIATLVRQAVSQGVEATIITGDKDLMQLVGDAVQIYDPMKERRYRAPEVEEKLGVPPCHVYSIFD